MWGSSPTKARLAAWNVADGCRCPGRPLSGGAEIFFSTNIIGAVIDREEMVDKVWNGAGVGRGAEWRGEGGTRRRRAQDAGLQSGCRKREGWRWWVRRGPRET